MITGGTKGIGAATAVALAEAGANVALAARNIDDEANALARRIEALGRRCLLIAADVGHPEEAARCVDQTVAELGSVDVLVHSAGGPVPGGILAGDARGMAAGVRRARSRDLSPVSPGDPADAEKA